MVRFPQVTVGLSLCSGCCVVVKVQPGSRRGDVDFTTDDSLMQTEIMGTHMKRSRRFRSCAANVS